MYHAYWILKNNSRIILGVRLDKDTTFSLTSGKHSEHTKNLNVIIFIPLSELTVSRNGCLSYGYNEPQEVLYSERRQRGFPLVSDSYPTRVFYRGVKRPGSNVYGCSPLLDTPSKRGVRFVLYVQNTPTTQV